MKPSMATRQILSMMGKKANEAVSVNGSLIQFGKGTIIPQEEWTVRSI